MIFAWGNFCHQALIDCNNLTNIDQTNQYVRMNFHWIHSSKFVSHSQDIQIPNNFQFYHTWWLCVLKVTSDNVRTVAVSSTIKNRQKKIGSPTLGWDQSVNIFYSHNMKSFLFFRWGWIQVKLKKVKLPGATRNVVLIYRGKFSSHSFYIVLTK